MIGSNGRTGGKLNLLASSIIGVALIVCTVIGAATLVRIKGFGNTIRVTGAAFKPIKSNFAIWDGTVSVQAPSLEAAYQLLADDVAQVKEFLQRRGYEDTAYSLSPIQISKQINMQREVVCYRLARSVRLELDDVERVKGMSNEVSELIEKGVMMESRSPRYLFTGLDSLKIEMIRAATGNAKLRAEQLAKTTGHTVGAPTSAQVGVFQIRALHSQNVSSRGISDVSSIDKEIVSTVHVSFLID